MTQIDIEGSGVAVYSMTCIRGTRILPKKHHIFTSATYCTSKVLSYPTAATYMWWLIALQLRLCAYKPV